MAIEIRPNYRKLPEVVLCMLHTAERIWVEVTQFDIVKAAFLAEMEMLEAYSIPITFDV